MTYITYLLGAGASKNCLPIVSEMKDHILQTHAWMSQCISQQKFSVAGKPIDGLDFSGILQDLEWLADLCDPRKNFSIDTFAKKLKVARNFNDYRKLKDVLTLYFTLQQKKNFPDVRYDNFWASLLDSNDKFPSNIRILSWNYDFQPELTYQDFINSNTLSESAYRLKVLSHSSADFHDPNTFAIFKLNGSATYYGEATRNSPNYLVDEIKNKDLFTFFNEVHNWYLTTKNPMLNYRNHLTYAWEHTFGTPFYNFLKESVKKTEILVVIGYSFPFFNREVDKLILGNDFMPNLRKVYFQAPENDVQNLIERFKSIRSVPSTIAIKDVYQFTLPNEMQ